jgi:hypothetical protein
MDEGDEDGASPEVGLLSVAAISIFVVASLLLVPVECLDAVIILNASAVTDGNDNGDCRDEKLLAEKSGIGNPEAV